FFFLRSSAAHRDLYSFPTRRSSDLEEALYDSLAMRQFVGIDLGREPAPDETTILRFRHLLESHDLGRQLFAAVSAHLQAQGLKVATGTIVDARRRLAPRSRHCRLQLSGIRRLPLSPA